ncbi:hypothetical protein ACFVXC_29280 [Streptomyces sp. NPDC058257]|uniref:hypothetical protein n=1 Tax=Streptomyces sp. NPDC058257 TaxID=3346409 RepID=UPI0036EE4F7F
MSAVTPPPRASLHRRLRMHTGYRWRNSGHPVLTWLRTAVDTRDGAVFPAVSSSLGGLSVSYSGLAEGLAYTLEFTELRRESRDGNAARRTESEISGKALRDPDRLPDSDIAIVGTSAAKARRLPTDASLIVPMRVHFVIDTDDGDSDAVRRKISKREREQFRRAMRRHEWTWAVEHDPAWFDVFYKRLYRPTMRERHGARERTETKDVSYECLFREGRMFSLSQNGKRVGGALCHWDRASRTLTLRLLGVVDGAKEHYDSGAFKAIYHFLIGWSADNGVRALDFQGTESFLSKGTYQWKRRFGTRVVLPPNHFGNKRLWFQVRSDTPEVRDFLVANPLLAEGADGALEAVYFHDADRAARIDYSAKSPGVERARHIDLDAFLATVPKGLARRAHS